MDSKLHKINQLHVQFEEETFKNDNSPVENVDNTHCFESTDRDIKMEIDAEEKHFENEDSNKQYSHMDTGLKHIDPLVKVKEEKFDQSVFENVEYSHCSETIDSNVQDIDNLHKISDTALRNIEQEGDLNKEGVVNLRPHLENKDTIYIFENTDSNVQGKDNVDDGCGMFVEAIHIKEEIRDSKDSGKLSDITDNCLEYVKKNSLFENTELTDSNITLTIDNCGAGISCLDNSNINDLNVDNCIVNSENTDLNFEKLDSGNKTGLENNRSEIGVTPKPILLIQRQPTFNHGFQVSQIGQSDLCHPNQSSFSLTYPEEHKHVNNAFQKVIFRKKGPERPFKCNMCEKGFKAASHLKIHLIDHIKEQPHPCNVCQKEFKALKNLRQHMITHSTKRSHQCSVCEKRYKTTSQLGRHIATHSTERPHQCNICDKGFRNLYDLRHHAIAHSTERPHQCNLCDKGFKSKGDLIHHITTHSTERPHQCSMCEKSYKTKGDLVRHVSIHSTERRYQCNTCAKQFKTANELTSHSITHTTERPHQCNMCEKAFKTKNTLRNHMISHSTERPHQCNICGRVYKYAYDLSSHSSWAHGRPTDWPHPCSMCEKAFKTKNALRKHMMSHSS